MRRSLLGFCLFAVFGISMSALAADDSSDTATKPDAIDKKLDKLIKSGKALIGKLVKVDGDKHVLTVDVTYAKPDPQAMQHLANLQVQLAQAQLRRNLQQVSHLQQQIDKATNNLYKGQTQKLEFDAQENMKVRTMLLPVEFDDKGKPRKLTAKEKKELKGPDPNLPGYTSDFDSLKADQQLEIFLAKQPPKSKDKDKDKEKDADSTESTRLKIAMIVILTEAKK